MLTTYLIDEIKTELLVDHLNCPRDPEIIGVFVVNLNHYQLNELECNGYTLTTEDCLYCKEQYTFLLRNKHANKSKVSPGVL